MQSEAGPENWHFRNKVPILRDGPVGPPQDEAVGLWIEMSLVGWITDCLPAQYPDHHARQITLSDCPTRKAVLLKQPPTTLFILRKREALFRRMGRGTKKSRQSI